MKKRMFTKPLAWFLAGTMLVGAGCKNYDDDIDAINNRLEGLESDVVQLQKDVVSLQATQDAFEKIDFASYVTNSALQSKLDDVLADYAKKSDLKAWLTSDEVLQLIKEKGYLTKTEIQNLIDASMLTDADVQDIFNNMLTAEAIMGKIQTDVQEQIADALADGGYMTGESALSTAQLNQILTAVAQSIGDENSAVLAAIKSWLGKDFATYMESYMSTESFRAAVGQSATASVLEELRKAESQLKTQINALISAALTGDEENPYIQKEELSAVLKSYDNAIAKLWSAVGDIAGRIQSLVYVPENAKGYVYFRGATLGDIALTTGKKATMVFQVSPASLAQSIIDGYNAEQRTVELKMLPEQIQVVSRAEEPVVFEIETAEVVENGKFALTVKTNFDYTSLAENKTYAVALHVSKPSSVTKPAESEDDGDTQIDTGIEYVSAYIPTLGNAENTDVIENIVLAKEGTKGFEQYAAPVEYRLEYDNTDTEITLLGEYRFAYDDGGELIELAQAAEKYDWDIVPQSTPAYARAEAMGGTADFDNLAVTPADPMSASGKKSLATVGIKKADVQNIDKTVTDKVAFAVAVDVNGKVETVEKDVYEATLTITRKSLGTISNIDATIDWFYDGEGNDGTQDLAVGYANDLYISADNIINAGILTNEQYAGVKESLKEAVWTIADDSDEELVAANNFEVKAVAFTDPYLPGDSKVLRYTVKGYKNGSGTLHVKTDIEVNDNEEITLEGSITFNGLDDLSYEINVPDGEILSINRSEGNIWVAIDDTFYKTMYDALPEGQKFFSDLSEFAAFMSKSSLNYTRQQANAGTHTAEAGLRNTNGDFRAFFKMADVDFNAADSYSYTTGADDNFEVAGANFRIALSGTVTINKGNNYFLQRQENLYTDGEPYYMKAKGSLNADKTAFEIQNVFLTAGYKANKTDGADVQVVYALNLPDGYTGAQPTLDAATGELSWGACTLLEIPVTATMTVNGLLMDYKEFVVKTDAPIDYTKLAIDGKNNVLSIEPDGKDATKNAMELLSLNDIFGNAIFKNGAITADPATSAYDFKAVFGEAAITSSDPEAGITRVSFDASTGIVTVKGDETELVHTIMVEIPVTMTYKYDQTVDKTGQYVLRAEERTITIKVTPKK